MVPLALEADVVGELAAAVLDVEAADDVVDAAVLQPPTSAAAAAIATTPVAIRTRLSLNMVLYRSFATERPLARQYIAPQCGERFNNITISRAYGQRTCGPEVSGDPST